ncbi:MAG TPA: HAMP domain-containing sensor histidine kinase [Gammaproteobacteria bacterium]|nr:HAMP domain-containing sensor histidine kinase [Gammaproteobacteria bacterium]
MPRFWDSVTFRIALAYGGLMIVTLVVLSSIFYYYAVVVQAHGIDRRLLASSVNMSASFASQGTAGLSKEITELLNDGVSQDTEVYLLLDAKGQRLAGNLTAWPTDGVPYETLFTGDVTRYGRASESRMFWHRLLDGSTLVVGRDLLDKRRIRRLVWRSLGVGGGIALLLVIVSALFFRRLLVRNLAAIRSTTQAIQSGNLGQRIPLGKADDEFMRLSRDINQMLDRIQQLMDGVRHVSNSIAHNLRTPLSRTRGQLEEALRHNHDSTPLSEAAQAAIQEIDALIVVFERLLQIAEAESGTRRQPFEPVHLAAVVTDVVELYDAMAETRGMTLTAELKGDPVVQGDRHLLAAALANLVENAVKYADGSPDIRVSLIEEPQRTSILVEDKGPGVPPAELGRVTERFYRLESRVPGTGLGLSIVTAIAYLHQGRLQLEDAAPGLRARIVLPRTRLPLGRDVSG